MIIEPHREIDAGALKYTPYMRTYEQLRGVLVPGMVIPDDVRISVFGNNKLRPNVFDLREVDKLPLSGCPYPGRSAHISFTVNKGIAYRAVFDREPKREDHLYSVRAGALLSAGFVAVYAPIKGRELHIRLVHAVNTNGSPHADVPYHAKIALAELVQPHKIS